MKGSNVLRAVLSIVMIMSFNVYGQSSNEPQLVAGIPVNYDEDKVGTYTLPDLLILSNGQKVKDTAIWINKRRPEILKMFKELQFGKAPGKPANMSFNVFDKGTPAFDGKVIRRQVTIYFTKDTSDYKMDLLIYLPADSPKPVPLLLTVSFSANSSAVDDPEIKPGTVWREGKKIPATASTRRRVVDVQQFIDNGIAYATVYYGDIEPDFT